MTLHRLLSIAWCAACVSLPSASGQTSSLGARQRRGETPKVGVGLAREAPKIARNRLYERYSWISVPPKQPRRYRVGDLLTVIVRERRQYEADAELNARKRLNLQSKLDAFVKVTGGGIGATAFRRGKPTVDYTFNNRLRSDADTQREDSLTFRLTGRIIDIKPNGVLVLEARAQIEHDDEISAVTLTGSCRKEDVTADNTILSTQLADKTVVVENRGALRAASSRGWILKALDFVNPF